jgi:hypothetical protein
MDFGHLSFLSHPSSTGAKHLTILSVSVPPGVVHGAFNAGAQEARVLPILGPASATWASRSSTCAARSPGIR